MYPNEYHCFHVLPFLETDSMALKEDLTDFLLTFPELVQKDASSFENSTSFPLVEIKLLLANPDEDWTDSDVHHLRTNFIAVGFANDRPENFEKIKSLCIRIAAFLNWQLLDATAKTSLWEPFSLTLYKEIDGKMHFWSVRNHADQTSTVLSGETGKRGHDETLETSPASTEKIREAIVQKRGEGFAEILLEDMAQLEIEYAVEDFGSEEDFDKQRRLKTRLHELLWQTGLGFSYGWSFGMDGIEVYGMVVDYKLAETVVAKDLEGTEFADYVRMEMYEYRG